MSAALIADREQLARFYTKIFRYAAPGGHVSLRGFRHRDDKPMFYGGRRSFPCAQIGDPHLIEQVVNVATWMARLAEGVVFCPPVATFTNDEHAREEDIAEGLAISVECDQRPAEARTKIEHLLGPATLAVASGGKWLNPITQKSEPKIHLHWCLTEPTRNQNEHRLLKQARDLAARHTAADTSARPIVHPLRWPGSWHRKDVADPRLATIIAETDNEVELGDALDALREAVIIDFGDDAGRGLENISRGERPSAQPDEYWRQLAEGVKKGTTGRIDAVIGIFGYLLRHGIEPRLAISLAHAYNRVLCDPALDDDKVDRALENIIRHEMRQ